MFSFGKFRITHLSSVILLVAITLTAKPTFAYSLKSNRPDVDSVGTKQTSTPTREAELERAEHLIDKREIESSAIPETISILTELTRRYPNNADAWALLSRSYYYSGNLSTSKSKVLDDYKRGLEAAKRSVEINPDHVKGNFWYGVNLGRVSTTKWGFGQLKNVKEIVFRMRKVIELDQNFGDGAPYLVLGRVYLEAPGRPLSIGSREKALQNLKKALELKPSNYETHFYLMELYELQGKRDLASLEADWLVKDEFHNSYPISAKTMKRKAQEILTKYRRK